MKNYIKSFGEFINENINEAKKGGKVAGSKIGTHWKLKGDEVSFGFHWKNWKEVNFDDIDYWGEELENWDDGAAEKTELTKMLADAYKLLGKSDDIITKFTDDAEHTLFSAETYNGWDLENDYESPTGWLLYVISKIEAFLDWSENLNESILNEKEMAELETLKKKALDFVEKQKKVSWKELHSFILSEKGLDPNARENRGRYSSYFSGASTYFSKTMQPGDKKSPYSHGFLMRQTGKDPRFLEKDGDFYVVKK